MHPIFRLLADRPQLLAAHAEAYGVLLVAELPRISAAYRNSVLLHVLALCGLSVGTILAGTALMLWVTTPVLPAYAPWVLLATPLAAWAAGLACALAARHTPARLSVDRLSAQVNADLTLFREASLR
jgi:hypothetical protein